MWLLTARGIFCSVRQARCRPEFTIVTTENPGRLSITLIETNRNLLFKTDSILISLESGLEGKWEATVRNFPLIPKKKKNTKNPVLCFNTKLAGKRHFSNRNSI